MIENVFDGSGERFKEIRKTLNMTQTDFAKILNISHGHISGIEKDKKNITGSVLDLLELKCNVNTEWLKTGNGEMFIKPTEDNTIAAASELLGEKDLLFETFIRIYRNLNPQNRELLLDFMTDFSQELLVALESRKEKE